MLFYAQTLPPTISVYHSSSLCVPLTLYRILPPVCLQVGWPGSIGALSGFSDQQLAISEIGVRFFLHCVDICSLFPW
jgi:hypothetical protein